MISSFSLTHLSLQTFARRCHVLGASFVIVSLFTFSPAVSAASSSTTTLTADSASKESQEKQPHNELDSYDMGQLQAPVKVPIQLPDDIAPNTTRLIRFSSLSPSFLAFLSQNGSVPDAKRFRVVDSAGRVMPMALRQVQQSKDENFDVPAVAVESDNPVAMEKLRQAIRIQIEKPAQHDNAQQAVNIELKDIPANQPLTQLSQSTNAISTWWLANPIMVSKSPSLPDKADDIRQRVILHLSFTQNQSPRPVQLQVYGSDDLIHWEMINQSVIDPFTQTRSTSEPSQRNTIQHRLDFTDQAEKYRYWQVIASQPLIVKQVGLTQTLLKPSYFLTRANFYQKSDEPGHWQLKLPTPMWVSGIDFFVPENQLWQVSLATTNEDGNVVDAFTQSKNTVDTVASVLVNGQVDTTNSKLTWSPSVIQNLALRGQMQADNLPVTLLTPVYELLFLAQGKAPYSIIINDPKTLSQSLIGLSNEQIAHLTQKTGTGAEAQMLALTALDNPEAQSDKYRQWLLWSVLGLVLVALSWLAYRLYQQITIQTKPE